MYQDFLVRLEKELGQLFSTPFSVKLVSEGSQDYFDIKFLGAAKIDIRINRDSVMLNEIISDENEWKIFLNYLLNTVMEEIYAICKEDFFTITKFFKHFQSNHWIKFEKPNKNNYCNWEVLDLFCCQTFIERIGTTFKTLSMLSGNSTFQQFLEIESPVGILLRSCILDSLLIFCWGNEQDFMSAVAAESFLRKDIIPADLIEQITPDFEAWANFFNNKGNDEGLFYSHPKKEVQMEKIFDRLKTRTSIQDYKFIYYFYSKYDHFSLFPWIYENTPYDKLEMMMESLNLIKHALSSLITLKTKLSDQEKQIIYEILGVSMTEDGPGNFVFVRT